MPEGEQVETTEEIEQAEGAAETTEETVVEEDPTAGLKKALAAERKARKDAERKAREFEASLQDRDKEPAEQAIEQAKREALEQAQSAYNQRLVSAELKAELKGKVRNVALALKVIDASEIEVSSDGDVDTQSVTDAIDALLEQYPELAPDEGKFKGGADQGARGKDSRPKQLTRTDIQNMTPQQIEKARQEGRLNSLLGVQS